jgi:hypothetical protein
MIENLQIIITKLREENKDIKLKQIQKRYIKPKLPPISKKEPATENFNEISQMMKKILEDN